ncbi:MAG: SMC family ATPase [Chloroflexi bacterium]|nr:SMC family ATPase [Chloroflexota bacterium]MYD49610.1 SMC family ATPase [Chloroflexota bacterium]
MIPLKLSVRNFLCYRDDVPPLDLRGIHVACLCGANGHGKSALLDAMTWCLWGQARTGSRNHDGLITYGETECRVELDFQAQGQPYRAIRRRRSAGRGRSELDLFVLDDGDHPRAITGNTLNETNNRIRRLVGMDYDTFVNSAFLLQGRSDEFTRKTPSERKEVLSSILGLGLYEIMQAAARDRRAEWQDRTVRAEGALTQSKTALEAIPDPTQELAAVEQRLTELDGELATASATAAEMQAIVEELRRKESELTTLERRIGTLGEDIRRANDAIATARQRIEDTQARTERAGEIDAGVQGLTAAREELERLETARREYDGLQERRNELQATIDREEAALASESLELARRIREELEPLAEQGSRIAGQLADLNAVEERLVIEEDNIDAQNAEAAELHGTIAVQQGELERCVADGKELRARQQDMASAGALCPLCRTPLTEDACGDIAEWYEAEIQAKLTLHEEIKRTLGELAQRHTQLVSDAERGRVELARRQRQTQQERGRLEQRKQQSAAASEQLGSLKPRLSRLQEVLTNGIFAGDQRANISEIDEGIATLGYDDVRREEAYRLTQALLHWESERRDLDAALARLSDDEAELRQNEAQAARWTDELRQAEAGLAKARVAVAELPERVAAVESAESTVAGLSHERDELLARKGRLQGDGERRRAYLDEIAGLERSHGEAQAEQGIYQELYAAFGRSGVPAMLIDAAVPHIETEANYLLGRMTDNRLAVKLETQRTNQGGNVTETLDILVSDELGSRSYDLFSGGEAFRINLALRIALSKVLSQRLGAPLPTLFIDEGFGTQDAAGRERIVDAIASIQDDFEKIIVITHLDDLKDLFPVRIEVLKTEEGSQFWLS